MTAKKQLIVFYPSHLLHVYGSIRMPSVWEQNNDRTLIREQLNKVTFFCFIPYTKAATIMYRRIDISPSALRPCTACPLNPLVLNTFVIQESRIVLLFATHA